MASLLKIEYSNGSGDVYDGEVKISGGGGNIKLPIEDFYIDNGAYEVIISYDAEQPETVAATLTLDIDSELDEVSEENNELLLIFEAKELPRKTSFSLTMSILIAFIAMLALPVIVKRRSK